MSPEETEIRRLVAAAQQHQFNVDELMQLHDDDAVVINMAGRRLFAMTTKGSGSPFTTALQPDDVFVFGRETSGLPPDILAEFPPECRLRLPMQPGQRSLNLSNAAAVTVFEAWR